MSSGRVDVKGRGGNGGDDPAARQSRTAPSMSKTAPSMSPILMILQYVIVH